MLVKVSWIGRTLRINVHHDETVEAVEGCYAHHTADGRIDIVGRRNARVDAEADQRILAWRSEHKACRMVRSGLVEPMLLIALELTQALCPDQLQQLVVT